MRLADNFRASEPLGPLKVCFHPAGHIQGGLRAEVNILFVSLMNSTFRLLTEEREAMLYPQAVLV